METVRDVIFRNRKKVLIRINNNRCDVDTHGEEQQFFDSVEDDDDESKKPDFSNIVLDESICGITEGNVLPSRLRARPEQGAAMITISEPSSFEEARKSAEKDKWDTAMREEIKSLSANGTWTLVPWTGQRLVDCRWTYKIKFDAGGKVDRYKARLVARGFTQRHGWIFGGGFLGHLQSCNQNGIREDDIGHSC